MPTITVCGTTCAAWLPIDPTERLEYFIPGLVDGVHPMKQAPSTTEAGRRKDMKVLLGQAKAAHQATTTVTVRPTMLAIAAESTEDRIRRILTPGPMER